MVGEEFCVPVRIGLSVPVLNLWWHRFRSHCIFPIVSGPWAFKLSPRLFEVPIIGAFFFNSLPWSLTPFSNFLQVTPESKLLKHSSKAMVDPPTPSSFWSRSFMVSGSTLHIWSSASLMEAFSLLSGSEDTYAKPRLCWLSETLKCNQLDVWGPPAPLNIEVFRCSLPDILWSECSNKVLRSRWSNAVHLISLAVQ